MNSEITGMHAESLSVGVISHPGEPDEDVQIRRFSRANVEALKHTPFTCIFIGSRLAVARLCLAGAATPTKLFRIHVGSLPLEGTVNYVIRRFGERRFESGRRRFSDLIEDVERGRYTEAVIASRDGTLDPKAIEAAIDRGAPHLHFIPMPRARSVDESEESLEARNREALLKVRREMLDRVKYLMSEDLASKVESTARNASQVGNDLRKAGKLFGVRFGREWYYPAFQLGPDGKPYAELSEILTHLSPDERGWDRLQWFLEPNPILGGRVPVEAFEKGDREAVLEVARQEVWQGRD